jgi:hypothetical protein
MQRKWLIELFLFRKDCFWHCKTVMPIHNLNAEGSRNTFSEDSLYFLFLNITINYYSFIIQVCVVYLKILPIWIRAHLVLKHTRVTPHLSWIFREWGGTSQEIVYKTDACLFFKRINLLYCGIFKRNLPTCMNIFLHS